MINFLVLGIFTYLGGAISQRTILFKLAYFFLFFHLIIKYYHYNIKKNLKITHQLKNDHLFNNEEIEIIIRAENNSFLPLLWLKFEEFLPGKLTTLAEQHLSYFKAQEKKEWKIALKAKKRGLYKIGPLRWEAGDFLGYDLTKGQLPEMEVYIYPKILSLEELGLPSRLPFGNSKWPQPIYKDPYQTAGIREYQPSDRLNTIHWKATARTGELKSRKNESTVSIDTALVLNFSQNDYGLKYLERKTELAVTAAASIAYYLNRAGNDFKFVSNAIIKGQSKEEFAAYQRQNSRDFKKAAENELEEINSYLRLPAGKGDGHLQQLLEILARVEISKDDNFMQLLLEELNLAWGGTIIIFSEKDDQDLMATAQNLLRRGYNVKIMILGEEIIHKEFQHRPFTAPLSIHHLRRERDLNGI